MPLITMLASWLLSIEHLTPHRHRGGLVSWLGFSVSTKAAHRKKIELSSLKCKKGRLPIKETAFYLLWIQVLFRFFLFAGLLSLLDIRLKLVKQLLLINFCSGP